MSAESRFADLSVRLASGLALAVLGLAAVWAGGPVFLALVSVALGLMAGELARMADPAAPLARIVTLGAAAGAGFAAAQLAGAGWLALPLALALALIPRPRRLPRGLVMLALAVFVLGGLGLLALRAEGLLWFLWLVLVVVASDVLGYVAGRLIGGRRLWPRVSPKKTWSGTLAGWAGAALAGAALAGPTGAGAVLVPLSVALAVAGQAGDIAESALKRHAGVKDASHLLPGHGGVMDRFDAMLGAGLAVLPFVLAGLMKG